MVMPVVVYFYSHLFSTNAIIPLDIRTEEKVLGRDALIISGLLVLIAWWLHNLSNILKYIMHQAL